MAELTKQQRRERRKRRVKLQDEFHSEMDSFEHSLELLKDSSTNAEEDPLYECDLDRLVIFIGNVERHLDVLRARLASCEDDLYEDDLYEEEEEEAEEQQQESL